MSVDREISGKCANRVGGRCLVNGGCLVVDGLRCEWFEKCVLAVMSGGGRWYRRRMGERVVLRRCECGGELVGRERRCEGCRLRRRRAQFRESKRKARSG